jgi:uncharacterized protein
MKYPILLLLLSVSLCD